MQIINIENETNLLDQPLKAGYCQSFFCRLRGLTFRKQVEPDFGLLLVQARDSKYDAAIHMMFVFTDLAVVWINSLFEVVDVRLAKKWHPGYIPNNPAQYVLEMAPQRIVDFNIGDRVKFSETPGI